jgi:hypothetical protein
MTKTANIRDEWDETWDWAKAVWGPSTRDDGFSFNTFFREIACRRAREEGWGEVGSSDVWHASYDSVKRIKAEGKVKTRADLEKRVREYMGY